MSIWQSRFRRDFMSDWRAYLALEGYFRYMLVGEMDWYRSLKDREVNSKQHLASKKIAMILMLGIEELKEAKVDINDIFNAHKSNF